MDPGVIAVGLVADAFIGCCLLSFQDTRLLQHGGVEGSYQSSGSATGQSLCAAGIGPFLLTLLCEK